jgi:hypothetical protein
MITFKEWLILREDNAYRLKIAKNGAHKTLQVPQTIGRPNMMKKK